MNAEQIIEALKLEPLDLEGGMYRCTYTSDRIVDGKPIGTAIYFLLTERSFSHMHRLPTDEVYHFYLGDPVELVELLPDGSHRVTILGQDVMKGEQVQAVAVAGSWQGSRLLPGGHYALLGTTMAPGYVSEDYEHGNREELVNQFPDMKEVIEALTGTTVFM